MFISFVGSVELRLDSAIRKAKLWLSQLLAESPALQISRSRTTANLPPDIPFNVGRKPRAPLAQILRFRAIKILFSDALINYEGRQKYPSPQYHFSSF